MSNNGLSEDNPLYDAVQRGKDDPDSLRFDGDESDDTGGDSSGGSSDGGGGGGGSNVLVPSVGGSGGNSGGGGGNNDSAADSGDSSSEGIGEAGTTAVDPDNPLADAVEAGGGFVEDGQGNVTGGPDGDGTARTEAERTSNRPSVNNTSSAPAASASDSSAGQSQPTGGSTSTQQNNSSSTTQPGGSGGPDGDIFDEDDPRDDMSGEEILYGEGQKVTNENADELDTLDDGTVVSEETVEDVETEVLGQLNEATGNEGQGFQPEDVDITTAERDGETVLTAQVDESGQTKLEQEQDRMVEEQLFGRAQSQTEATLDSADVSFSEGQEGQIQAELTDSGRLEEAAAQNAGLSADDLFVGEEGQIRTRRQTPDVTFGEANAALNAGASGDSGRSGSNSPEDDLFSGPVGSAEDLTGFDVPGEGALVSEGQSNTESTGTGRDEAFGGTSDFEEDVRDAVEQVQGPIEDAAETTGDLFAIGGSAFAAGSPVTEDDPARAAGSDETGSRLGDVAEGTVLGASEVVNAPVAGIEAGEVALEGVDSAPITGGSAEESQDFVDDAAAAGALQAERAARAAQNNPFEFGGQLLGGAIVGSTAQTVARNGISRGRTPDLDGERAGRNVAGSDESSGLLADRGPNVEAELGRNAARGNVELNINADLRRRIDEQIQGGQQRVSGTIESAADAVDQAGETARQAPAAAADRATTAARNAEVSADAAVQAGRELAGEAPARVRQQLDEAASSASDTVRNAEVSADAAVQAGRARLSDASDRAELAARRARRDLGMPTVPRGTVTDGGSSSFLFDEGTGRADLSANIDRLGEQFDGLASSATDTVRGAEVSADAAVQAGLDRLSDASNRARLGARRARRDLGLSEPPRGFVTDREGSSFIGDTSTGRGQPLSLTDAADELTDRVRGLSDVGLRVDIGRPRSRTVDADDLEIDGEVGLSVDGDAMDGLRRSDSDGDADVQIFEVDADEAGDGTLALRRADTDTDARPRLDTDTRRRRSGFGLAPLAGGIAGGVGGVSTEPLRGGAIEGTESNLGFGTDAELGFGTGAGTDLGTGPQLDLEAGSDLGIGFETEEDLRLGPESGAGNRIDLGSGIDFGNDLDQRGEQPPRLETSIRFDGLAPGRPRGSAALPDTGSNREDELLSALEVDEDSFDSGIAGAREALGAGGAGGAAGDLGFSDDDAEDQLGF